MQNRPLSNRNKWLYHLLPAVFWLLAIGGSLIPMLPSLNFQLSTINYYSGYWVAAIMLIIIVFIGRIKRHSSSVEECFVMALLLGIASYWIPTVVFLTIPVWAYLIYRVRCWLRSWAMPW